MKQEFGGHKLDSLSRKDFLKLSPLVAIAAITACRSIQEQSSTTRVDYDMTVEPVDGKIAVQLFISPKHYFDEKQKEVTQILSNFVNSGNNDIVSVKTSYSNGYLTAGQADYAQEKQGKGNKIRIKLVQSGEYYWDNRDKDVKKKLDDVLKNTQNVHKVNTIFGNGYLLAAEVWYFEP